MSVKTLAIAFAHDVERLWHAIEGSPAVQEVEKIATDAVVSELDAVLDKFLGDGTPLDKEAEVLVQQLATWVVAKLPTQAVAQPTGSGPQPAK